MAFSAWGDDGQAEAERPYPPTARRLERLRARALGPHAVVVRGAAVAIVGVGAAALGGAVGPGLLARALGAAARAGRGSVAWSQLVHVGAAWLAVMVAVLGACGAVAYIADGVVAGFGTGALGRRGMSYEGRRWQAARGAVVVVAGIGLCCLACAVVVAAGPRRALSDGAGMLMMAGAVAAGAMVALATVDAGVGWLSFLSRARMTRRELAEEMRETRGPLVWRRRRQRLLWGRRR